MPIIDSRSVSLTVYQRNRRCSTSVSPASARRTAAYSLIVSSIRYLILP